MPQDRVDEEKQQSHKPAQTDISTDENDGDEVPTEKEILVSIVDEVVEVESTAETVTDTVEPNGSNNRISNSEVSVQTVPSPVVTQTKEQVNNTIRPQQSTENYRDQLGSNIEISTLETVEVEQTDIPVIKQVQPSGRSQLEWDGEVTLAERIKSERINETVSNMTKPHQSNEQLTDRDGFFEIDEEDPVFSWGGGSPFGSDRPRFVVHVDNDEVPSLQFLQVLLRDTYKEVRGGEPGAKTVEFVANEPRMPTVQKNIVTLDLDTGEWEADMRNGSPEIRRQDSDIVPKLKQIAAELYTGDLGYFVLNVPADFKHKYRRKRYHRKLVETMANQEVSENATTSSSLVEKLKASPVTLAEPRTTDQETFFEKVSQYFSLSPIKDATSVAQIEEVQERVLTKNDWRRVALTEQQETGEESNEHYLWKAAITEGLARKMWETNEQGFNEFDSFLQRNILASDVIKTEVENPDRVEGNPDVYIETSEERWKSEGLKSFIHSRDNTVFPTPIAIEFETGRSEGAFNFRKLRDTLDKYTRNDIYVCLVVPDRLLFQGRKRANMINTLVETWNESNGANARLFTPIVEGGNCTGLQPAEKVINELYGDDDEE